MKCDHCGSRNVLPGNRFCTDECASKFDRAREVATGAPKPGEYDARTVTVKFHGQAVDFNTLVGEFAPDVDEDDEPDMINSPPHYTQGDIESIEYIEDQGHGRGFCYGNALKYLARAPHKGCERADLLKAIWYIERLLDGTLAGDQVDGG